MTKKQRFTIDNPAPKPPAPAPPHVIIHATGPHSLQVDTNVADPLEAVKMLGAAVQIMMAKIQEQIVKSGNGKILNANGQKVVNLNFGNGGDDAVQP